MKALFLLFICMLIAATAVLCENKIKKKIEEVVKGCSEMVKELEISGTEAFKPTRKDAEKKLKKLKKLLKIMKIKDEEKRAKKLKEHPDLEVLQHKFDSVKDLLTLPKVDAEAVLNQDYDLLKTVVKLAYLDPKNKHSPIFGEKLSKLLGIKHGKGELKKRKKFHRSENIRLLYSTVIPPGQKLPDASKIVYTDKRGRTCYCMC